MSKRPLTTSGIPAPLGVAMSSTPSDAIAALVGDADSSIKARANLTICHTSTTAADAFEMVYLSLGEGEALVTLAADVGTEVRLTQQVAMPTFGDAIVDANAHIVGYFLREDTSTEIEGSGTLNVMPGSRYIVEIPTQFLVDGDVLLLNDHFRVVQSVSPSGGISSIHLDRAMPDDGNDAFVNWRYLRRSGASMQTQLRKGEGTLTVSGKTAVYKARSGSYGSHPLFAGDTVFVGLHARTLEAATGNVFVFDESIPDALVDAEFAWTPPDGQKVGQLFLRQGTLEANATLRVGNINIDGEMGSFGDSGAVYATTTGNYKARYLNAKDVLHVRVRSGYRQVLSGFPVQGRDTVLNGTPPMVCAQSISAAAAGGATSQQQLYHGFSLRVEPPQQQLSRFVNV